MIRKRRSSLIPKIRMLGLAKRARLAKSKDDLLSKSRDMEDSAGSSSFVPDYAGMVGFDGSKDTIGEVDFDLEADI